MSAESQASVVSVIIIFKDEERFLDEAISEALREVGPALILVTVVVVAGFSVLMLGRFEVLFLIGLLTTSAALLAVLADLVGFPAFLRAMGHRSGVQSLLSRRLP